MPLSLAPSAFPSNYRSSQSCTVFMTTSLCYHAVKIAPHTLLFVRAHETLHVPRRETTRKIMVLEWCAAQQATVPIPSPAGSACGSTNCFMDDGWEWKDQAAPLGYRLIFLPVRSPSSVRMEQQLNPPATAGAMNPFQSRCRVNDRLVDRTLREARCRGHWYTVRLPSSTAPHTSQHTRAIPLPDASPSLL